MISPEIIRRYPFFAGLSNEQIITLAEDAEEKNIKEGYVFFKENDFLKSFYLVLDGTVGIVIEIPDLFPIVSL